MARKTLSDADLLDKIQRFGLTAEHLDAFKVVDPEMGRLIGDIRGNRRGWKKLDTDAIMIAQHRMMSTNPRAAGYARKALGKYVEVCAECGRVPSWLGMTLQEVKALQALREHPSMGRTRLISVERSVVIVSPDEITSRLDIIAANLSADDLSDAMLDTLRKQVERLQKQVGKLSKEAGDRLVIGSAREEAERLLTRLAKRIGETMLQAHDNGASVDVSGVQDKFEDEQLMSMVDAGIFADLEQASDWAETNGVFDLLNPSLHASVAEHIGDDDEEDLPEEDADAA